MANEFFEQTLYITIILYNGLMIQTGYCLSEGIFKILFSFILSDAGIWHPYSSAKTEYRDWRKKKQ